MCLLGENNKACGSDFHTLPRIGNMLIDLLLFFIKKFCQIALTQKNCQYDFHLSVGNRISFSTSTQKNFHRMMLKDCFVTA